MVISLLLPLVTLNQGRRDPKIQAEIDRTTAVTPSAVERFGLFTIIVLGEVVAAVVRGVAGLHDLTWLVVVLTVTCSAETNALSSIVMPPKVKVPPICVVGGANQIYRYKFRPILSKP